MIAILSCVLPFVAALIGSPWAYSVVLVAAHVVDRPSSGGMARLLGVAGTGPQARFTFRQLSLLAVPGVPRPMALLFVLLCFTGILVDVLRAKEEELHEVVGLTRNLSLDALRVPTRLPAIPPLTQNIVETLAAVAIAIGIGLPAAGPALVLLVGAVASLTVSVALARHLGNRPAVRQAFQRELQAHAPEVVLYFAGPKMSAYQANMWLDTLAALNRPAAVILRDPEAVEALNDTDLPVVCLEHAGDMMAFKLPSVKVVLYPANSGMNSHMLRLETAMHVFVCHGDSDKSPSINPFTKAYNEVWVAGPAGRERYLKSRAGVRDEAIVEVGRPQLAAIKSGPTGNERFTVLYAPTWEGWSGNDGETSVAQMGVRIVRTLLAHGVDVVYRPHPMLGHRDAKVRAAHKAILALPGVLLDEGAVPESFNRTDMLVTDVSSLISDYLATGRPYAVANVKGLPEAEFHAACPSVSAGYLIDPACDQLPSIIKAARADDPLAERREQLRAHLLGPAEADSLSRISDAIDMLAKRAES